jgi:RNA polymerase sigma-70 factor, ECF subfamily
VALTEPAFGEFYRRHARSVWVYVYRVTGNATEADDIVQDAFCRLLQAEVSALNDEDLRRYVFRIASNLIADGWRRSARHQSWLTRIGETIGIRQTPRYQADVSATFAELRPRERALLWLAYIERQDHAQIASSLGLARGSIKVLLFRARARLRDRLRSKGLNVNGGIVQHEHEH